jgi:hypothetical protein
MIMSSAIITSCRWEMANFFTGKGRHTQKNKKTGSRLGSRDPLPG